MGAKLINYITMADVFQFEIDGTPEGNFDADDNDEIILDDVSEIEIPSSS